MYSEYYKNQFSLLLKVLPCLKEQDSFIIKGGTAINLFYRDLPRISVDIDLTYRIIENRELTIKNMNQALCDLELKVMKRIHGVNIAKRLSKDNDCIVKLIVADGRSVVKIEPNFIFRGYLSKGSNLKISKKVTEVFGAFIDDIPVASFSDVYAGKICAALNRQHPRDLFDIKLLFENEGLTELLRQTLVVYLACDSRPINELLNPNLLDIAKLYMKEFNNMTVELVSLDELLIVREKLLKLLPGSFTKNEREFLLSVKQGDPDYSLLPFEHLNQLPALQWKIINVRKMDKVKRVTMLKKLKAVLE